MLYINALPGTTSPGVDSLGGHCERLAGGHRVGRFHILTNFINGILVFLGIIS